MPSRRLIAAAVRVLVVALAGVLALPACGSKGLEDVRVGMSREEVEQIVGRPPDRIAAACIPTVEMWIFEGTRDKMTSFIHFEGDRVVEVVRGGKRLAPVGSAPVSKGCGTLPEPPPGT